MKDIDKILMKSKKTLDDIEVPNELEDRLLKALEDKESNCSKSTTWNKKIIAACLIVFIISFNFNTLAYYSKKLLGYDQIMDSTLKNLNELGNGQIIGESYTFSNGVVFTLDGIMIDENQLLAFYTVSDPSGELESYSLNPRMEFKGFFKRYHMSNGHGEIDEVNNETKWIMSFDTPAFYERTLELEVYFSVNGSMYEEGNISFKLDRNKAMKSSLKQTINKTFESDGVKVRFNSILASPTTTVIEGSIQNIVELAIEQISGERIRPNDLDIELIVNGKELEKQTGSMKTDLKGITFSSSYDALPNDIESLQIRLQSLSIDKDVNSTLELSKDYEANIAGQTIKINEVYESDGSTYVTFTTDDSVVLTRVFLMIDGEKVSLKETLYAQQEKYMDGSITRKRTMHFPKVGDELELLIETMTYSQRYNEVIDIPIK